MKTSLILNLVALACAMAFPVTAATRDWLIDPTPYIARVGEDQNRQELVLENGLIRRVLRLAPNAATIDYRSLVTGEQLLRATGPEAVVTLNGREYAIGGLAGQPVKNYLKAQWVERPTHKERCICHRRVDALMCSAEQSTRSPWLIHSVRLR